LPPLETIRRAWARTFPAGARTDRHTLTPATTPPGHHPPRVVLHPVFFKFRVFPGNCSFLKINLIISGKNDDTLEFFRDDI
jgi:hypothetical protein